MSIEEQDVDLNNEVELEDSVEETPEDSNSNDTFERMERTPAQKKSMLERQLKQLYKKNPELAETKKESNKQESLSADEARLIAQGFEDDAIEHAKVIQAGLRSQGKDIPLREVTKHELFVSWQAAQESKKRRDSAQLGASSSGTTSSGKSIGEMTEAEHRAYFNKMK